MFLISNKKNRVGVVSDDKFAERFVKIGANVLLPQSECKFKYAKKVDMVSLGKDDAFSTENDVLLVSYPKYDRRILADFHAHYVDKTIIWHDMIQSEALAYKLKPAFMVSEIVDGKSVNVYYGAGMWKRFSHKTFTSSASKKELKVIASAGLSILDFIEDAESASVKVNLYCGVQRAMEFQERFGIGIFVQTTAPHLGALLSILEALKCH